MFLLGPYVFLDNGQDDLDEGENFLHTFNVKMGLGCSGMDCLYKPVNHLASRITRKLSG